MFASDRCHVVAEWPAIFEHVTVTGCTSITDFRCRRSSSVFCRRHILITYLTSPINCLDLRTSARSVLLRCPSWRQPATYTGIVFGRLYLFRCFLNLLPLLPVADLV